MMEIKEFIFLLMSSFYILKLTTACPSVCKCSFTVVSCDDANLRSHNLTNIIKNIPNDTQILYMQQNNLVELPLELFKDIKDLRDLHLRGNQISHLPKNKELYLPNLQKLILDDNAIVEINPEDLKGYEKLRELHLAGNRIRKIPEKTFEKLTNLRSLFLQTNQIKEILKDSFKGLINLMSLNLEANILEKIAEGSFDELKNIQSIQLNQNYLREIPNRLFSHSTQIDLIDLVSNEIQVISKYAFANMSSMKQVDIVLDSNEIITLSSSSFEGSRRLRISLSDNIFKCDCQLMYNYHDIISTDHEISITGAACVSPTDLFDTLISSVNATQLNCSPCDFHICHNGGSCRKITPKQAICDCTEYFEGKNCENFIIKTTEKTTENSCDDNFCQNNSTCTEVDINKYECLCQRNYQGKFCDIYKKVPSKNSRISSLATYIAIGVCVLVLILGICITVFFCRRKKRHNNNHLLHRMEENKSLDEHKDEELSSIDTFSSTKKISL